MSLLFAFRFIYTLIREKYPRYRVQFEGTRYLLLLFIVIYCGLVSQELELFITAGTTISPSSPIGTDDGNNDISNSVILSMGLSQLGRCVNDNTHSYYVKMKDLYSSNLSNNSSIQNQNMLNYEAALSRSLNYDGVEPHKMASPICYYDQDISCIDDDHFRTCQHIFASPTYQYSINDFTALFTFDDQQLSHPYFPYIQLIVNLAILGIFFIAAHGVTQLRIHKFILSLCNEINGFLLFLLILQSIHHIQFIFQENCLQLLNTSIPEHEKFQFCSTLQSCGLTVSSVLDLNGNIAQYYQPTLGFFSLIWILFILIHLVCFIIHHIHLHEIYAIEALQQRILEQSGNDLITTLDTAPKPFVDLYLSHWEYIPLSTLQSMQSSSSSSSSIVMENTNSNNTNNTNTTNNDLAVSAIKINPLHVPNTTTVQDECNNVSECSICLGSLLESTASAAADATASATASSLTSHHNSVFDVQRLMRRVNMNMNRIRRQLSHQLSLLWTRTRNTMRRAGRSTSSSSSSSGGAHIRLATDAESAMDSEIATTTMSSPITLATSSYDQLQSPIVINNNSSSNDNYNDKHKNPSINHQAPHQHHQHQQYSSYSPLFSPTPSNGTTQHLDHEEITDDSYIDTINHTTANSTNEAQMQHVIKLYCHHAFHQACILQWASTAHNTQCPVCRQPLHQDPDSNSFSMALLQS